MKFFKKFWYLFLILFFVVLGVILFLIFTPKNEDIFSDYYYYVKDNTVTLWNKKTNQKYVLSDNYGDGSNYDNYYYVKLSNDGKKVIYVDNNYDEYFSISYVEVDFLNKLKKEEAKEEKNHLIAKNVTKFDVIKDGVIYLKNENLYFYNFDTTEKLSSDIEDFYIGDSGNSVYYIDKDNALYKITPSNDEKEKVKSEVESAVSICNNAYYVTEMSNSYAYNLYVNGDLISKNVSYFYSGFCNETYFVAYSTAPKNDDDVNKNLATYHYKNGKVEKLADGFIFGESEEYFQKDYYIYAEYENTNDYFINVLDKKKNKITKVPITSDESLTAFNVNNGDVLYKDEEGEEYYLKYNDGEFEKKVHLGSEICRIAWKDDELYFVEACLTDNNTGTIYQYKNGEMKEITRDGYDILNVNDKIYYSTYDGNIKEFYSYDDKTILSDNYFQVFSYNDVLYYAQDEYESGKDGFIYADVYYLNKDNKPQLVDNDILDGVIQELK